jgi:hypothetical protein
MHCPALSHTANIAAYAKNLLFLPGLAGVIEK